MTILSLGLRGSHFPIPLPSSWGGHTQVSLLVPGGDLETHVPEPLQLNMTWINPFPESCSMNPAQTS